MSNYQISLFDPNDFNTLIPLMKDCFGIEESVDYFRWKFLDNPAGKALGFIAIETESNEVAAFFAVIPENYIVEGKKRVIYQACDAMTHSNHRRKGLFQKLVSCCEEHLENKNELFIFALGSSYQSMAGFLKMGWEKIFNFQYPFLPRLLCRTASFVKDSGNVREIHDLDVIKHLIETEAGENKIYSYRNIEHMKWRLGNPRNNYKVKVYQSLEIEGYVSYYTENQKIFLFDFIFSTEESRRKLIRALKKQVVDERLKGIVAFCQERGASAKTLKRSGFLINPFNRGPLSEKPLFVVRSNQQTMIRFKNPADWTIKSYDYDAS